MVFINAIIVIITAGGNHVSILNFHSPFDTLISYNVMPYFSILSVLNTRNMNGSSGLSVGMKLATGRRVFPISSN